jgi:hypothetical protein
MEVGRAGLKLTFAKGASLKDPAGLFTSSLAFKALVRQAVALNSAGTAKRSKKAKG